MANGAESEEFVVLSKVRAGHRREFEFAVRSQNEIAGSLSRTRARTSSNNPVVAEEGPSFKRAKKSVGRPRKNVVLEEKKVVLAVESEEEPKSDVVDMLSDDDENDMGGQLVESQRRDDIVTVCDDEEKNDTEDLDLVGNAMVTACEDQLKNDPVVEDHLDKCTVKMVPKRLKDLLETGLLEGLSVKYIRGVKSAQHDKGLAGIVRGSGILCFCGTCKGSQVVKPNQFELHAGSANKRPLDYIYLENGKTLRDVLFACKNANQENLVLTILNAVRSSSGKSSTMVCLSCKRPVSEAAVGLTTLLCSSCTELKASQMTPAQAVNTSERSAKPASKPKSSTSVSKTSSPSAKSQGRITRKDLRLHKLVFEDGFLPDGTEVGYYVRGKKLLSGYKKGYGIFCFCCNTEVSPSQFEAHAGWASRRKPYLHIYTSNGASLHELSLTLSRTRKFSTYQNDDLCSICHEVGDLLCCDGCPRAFHTKCVPLSNIPQDKWYCKYCEDMFQKEKFAERNPNAIAAGRVPGVDPIEQITSRCIRIVKTLDTQDGGCALCRAHDFCESGFGPRTVIICDQCEKEYHVGCLREHKMHYLKELPIGDWFCCAACERIHSVLKELVEHGEQKLSDYLIDVIKKKLMGRGLNGDNLDIRWRLFNGRTSNVDETRSLLSKAVSVFHEQFDPIGYGELKQDLIPHMVYGRNVKEREFGGMFCAVLSVNSTIVSAGVFRIFGKEVAEVPLVATSKDYEGKGYFQCLYSCIERLLADLDVKNILLPAAEEARSLWTNRFGYNEMLQEQFNDLKRRYALMIFDGTSMLHKPVPKSRT